MKRIGILYDKESKKVFLLPQQVKALTSKGVSVTILSGLGQVLKISDTEYLNAGATISNQWQSVISGSDIILKTNSFNSSELKLMNKKIAITMANYLANVDMLYHMLVNKVTGLEWAGLADHSGYLIFPKLEERKATLIMELLVGALSTGLAKRAKDKVTYPKNPKMLILNATFAGIALAKLALQAGYDVTIADNDTKYLTELKNSGLKIKTCNAHFETLSESLKEMNIFVNTSVGPTERTRSRITKEMVQHMPKGAMLIDASCENGYVFHFIKRFAEKEIKWINLEKVYYLAPADMTDIFPKKASEIISQASVDHLLMVANSGVDNAAIWKLTNCQDGKVVNATINAVLHLY